MGETGKLLKSQKIHETYGDCDLCNGHTNLTKTEIYFITKYRNRGHGLLWLCKDCREGLKLKLEVGE
jgi:hypothetical protein